MLLKLNMYRFPIWVLNAVRGYGRERTTSSYVQIKEEEGESVLVRSKTWDRGGRKYRFKKDDIVPTLQNRGEVNGLVVTPDKLKTAVIYPQGEIKGELRDYIDLAETYHDTKGRRFKRL